MDASFVHAAIVWSALGLAVGCLIQRVRIHRQPLSEIVETSPDPSWADPATPDAHPREPAPGAPIEARGSLE